MDAERAPLIVGVENIPHSRPWICNDDVAEVTATLRYGMIAKGDRVKKFEQRCAAALEVSQTWAFASGQVALEYAIRVLKLPRGADIIIPTYVCHAVRDAVIATGANPVYCDVGEDWCINVETVASAITANTGAIIIVHTFGIVAEVDEVRELGIPIIEDCCQCFSRMAGKLGELAVYSFHATKCLTTGEGGMIGTTHETWEEKVSMCLQDQPEGARMSDIQAALGDSQLKRYDEMLRRREYIASVYMESFPQAVTWRLANVRSRTIYFRFPISVHAGFDYVAGKFLNAGIQVRRGVDELLHRVAGLSDDAFPVASELYRTTISIPIYPALDDDRVNYIACRARECLA